MAGLRKGQVKQTPEERKATKKAWYQRNKSKILAHYKTKVERRRETTRLWAINNKERKHISNMRAQVSKVGLERRSHDSLMRRFKVRGLTLDQYHAIMERQDFQCAICKEEPVGNYGGFHDGFHIDHHHGSGRVRGLLCKHCNVGLGMLKDSPEVCRLAANYLEQRSVAAS